MLRLSYRRIIRIVFKPIMLRMCVRGNPSNRRVGSQYIFAAFFLLTAGQRSITKYKTLTIIVDNGDISCGWVEHDTFVSGAQLKMEGFIILYTLITDDGDGCALLLTCTNAPLEWCRQTEYNGYKCTMVTVNISE